MIILSCNAKQDFIIFESKLLEVIEIDSITPRNINRIFYAEEIESIYFHNQYNHSIYFYNLVSKDWLLTPIPQSYLKNRNLKIGDTYFHNFDSIFVQDLSSHSVVILNSKSEIVNTFSTFNPLNDDHIDGVKGNTQMVLDLPYLYIQIRPTPNAKYRTRYLMQQINIETGKREYLLEDSNQTNYSSKTYERYTYHNKNSKEFFITQPFSDVIIKYNYESSIVNYIDALPPLKNRTAFNNDFAYYEHYLLSNPWYGSIVYYEEDDLIFRSIYQGMDIPKSAIIKNLNYRSLNNDTILFNTIVLKNDEVVGTIRDFNLYNSSFVHRGFLYTLDFDYKQGDEDIIVFKKIDLSRLSNEN